MDSTRPPSAVDATKPGLTEQIMLEFESRHWNSRGAKLDAIRAELSLSPAKYYQVLGAVIDSPEALRSDPVLVYRLRRLREHRVGRRQRRLGVISAL
ncbi:MAG TPA: DUF3263 domain-containing protein [Candidatus Lumbricidophila sp.]|nr:DUF3263 domain-containing protein [Candidatus Lumbricidophila sp.]